nr:hypothetical protein TDPV-001 [Oriental turtle dovepox virus]WIK87678.1 hypothetical protein TDPV-380 [Oriental turtle dovepox virus]
MLLLLIFIKGSIFIKTILHILMGEVLHLYHIKA